jgi:glutamate-1-semialdehyde 2,1-aminomutase
MSEAQPSNSSWLERFQAVMPWGSSTCSKAPLYSPDEPSAIVRGSGCRVWDRGGAVITSTFGGETLSLAACKAAMEVYVEQDVVSHLWKQGKKMWEGLNHIFRDQGIPLEVKGFWPCPAITPLPGSPEHIEEAFYRAAYRNGVSLYGVSYVNFSHQDSDIEEALQRLETACRSLAKPFATQ